MSHLTLTCDWPLENTLQKGELPALTGWKNLPTHVPNWNRYTKRWSPQLLPHCSNNRFIRYPSDKNLSQSQTL